MSTADKLTQIAENVPKVFAAGYEKGKGQRVEESDVNFYDYDGTLLYSYTLAEAQALTELPPAPTPKKPFIQFEEWNWTLAQIKELNLPVNVGASYKTVDGKTYAIIEVTDERHKEVTLNYTQWCSSIKVSWGDGTSENETTSGSGTVVTVTHTYPGVGRYTITIETSGTWNVGSTSGGNPLVGTESQLPLSSAFLKELYIGSGARLTTSALNSAINLECITLQKSTQVHWVQVFKNCVLLKMVVVPSITTQIYSYFMENCLSAKVSFPYNLETLSVSSLRNVTLTHFTFPHKLSVIGAPSLKANNIYIPDAAQTIDAKAFFGNTRLFKLEIPSNVTTIEAQAFSECSNLIRLRFKSTTPPTVENANAFSYVPSCCVVEVPSGTLAAYQAATNYASIAAQMVEV